MTETTRLVAPWRRYFARALDGALYNAFFMVVLGLGLKINVNLDSVGVSSMSTLAIIALTFGLEPLLLSRFGTTFGKWVFGLHIVNGEGSHLTYHQAMERTMGVFWRGNGAYIPIYGFYRNYRSFADTKEGWELPWEEDNYLLERDQSGWRWILYAVLIVGLMGVKTWSGYQAGEPSHRGDLTLAEFSENYNQLVDYYELSDQYRLDENGQWVEDTNPAVNYVSLVDATLPNFQYTVEGGYLTAITMTVTPAKGAMLVGGGNKEMRVVTLAFAGAQPSFSIVPAVFHDVIKALDKDIICDIQGEMNGITIIRTVDQLGYTGTSCLYNGRESDEAYYEAEYNLIK